MRVTELLDIEQTLITGGATCQCRNTLVTSHPNWQSVNAAIIWTKEVPTKSECIEKCCDETGGAGFVYGYGTITSC